MNVRTIKKQQVHMPNVPIYSYAIKKKRPSASPTCSATFHPRNTVYSITQVAISSSMAANRPAVPLCLATLWSTLVHRTHNDSVITTAESISFTKWFWMSPSNVTPLRVRFPHTSRMYVRYYVPGRDLVQEWKISEGLESVNLLEMLMWL